MVGMLENMKVSTPKLDVHKMRKVPHLAAAQGEVRLSSRRQPAHVTLHNLPQAPASHSAHEHSHEDLGRS